MKITILTIAALAGIGTAIKINAKAKLAGPTYYGILGTDGKVRWSKVRPGPIAQCYPFYKLACTITSTSPESTVLSLVDQFPPQFSILNGSQYKINRPPW